MAAFTDYRALDFSGLDKSINGLGERQKEREATLALLGAFDQSQGISPAPAPTTGLAALGQFLRAPQAVQAPSSPAVTGSAASPSLLQNESGGRWDAQNSAVGAGGAVGHFGRAQFGQARLQEAANAGAIPVGTTPQQFMQSPDLQKSAENWHFNDIDQSIKANGFDRLIGQATIGGVPVTVEGLRAVAHLGGKEGMRKFVESNGAYNPPDANGTRLSDYFARHGGGGQPAQVAQAPLQQQGGGTYAQSSPEDLQGFLNNPRVPEPMKQMMREELASRQGGMPQQPPGVQVAENEADVQRLEAQQNGTQTAQADLPAPGASQAQGFAVPGSPAPAARQNVNSQMIRSLLANPGTRDIGKALWQQTLTGKSFGFQVVGDQLYRTNPQTGAVEPVGVSKPAQPVTVGEGQTLVNPRDGSIVFQGQAKKGEAAAYEERRAQAARAGMKEGDPGYQSFVLTGKMPREDSQPLTATDKNAILTADEAVASGEGAIRALTEAKGLSKQAMSGPTAGWRAAAGNNLPDWLVLDAIASPGASEATANLENTVTSNALGQMKSIFGGNPTEGERKILLDIQGSIGQPDNVRQGIYDRAIRAAEARLAFNRQRATELRGGSYYKPQAGDPGGAVSGAPRGAQPPQRQQQAQPDMSQAKRAADGKYYIPDPSRPGKYLMVQD
jgi:hypothetical protein